MPSPFPGMDPYLEGYLWVDVHNALASKIRQQLAPKIQPGYTVPLCLPDVDAPLDLAAALRDIYDEVFYHLLIDYRELSPKPVLTADALGWVDALLAPLRTEV
ncbi:DUF4058 family protein (plasmid) [Phormidium sp. CLA17]|uniref:DUF4058 family protein n=1 Tax=Leptolyngbya sp. Cla-17 TaxID=2803751 RepID=UPI001490F0AE|nr:DUF4058 family protein [Leptolyngbya sp. Cla-17]MBM0745341.1 DUF4058 family protein [Leptolyngbya sp. Cla-17]MBM0745518.1 DUF4058 family protein [Leptolyngbya sp. Cla-17]